jgi:hypothetical protein
MKTLVIHPKDNTTDFLCDIYMGKDWTIVNKLISKSELRRLIKTHDRIIMLGHGSEDGLFDLANKRFVIDSSWVDMLRQKDCICIWCNANVFFEKYGLKGFYTGMIVSDIDEAYYFSLPTDWDSIVESNTLFASSIKDAIDTDDMLAIAKSKYDSEKNPIINYNKYNLFHS